MVLAGDAPVPAGCHLDNSMQLKPTMYHFARLLYVVLFALCVGVLPGVAAGYGQSAYYSQSYYQSYYQASYINISTLITGASFSVGAGGYAPNTYAYWGGGGGGGLIINGTTVKGEDGHASAGNGGHGYGAGGGGSNVGQYGGAGAPGAVYVEWVNQLPAVPTITGTSPLAAGSNGTYTFKSTDPESDPVRYAIDWDMNGSVDQYVPSTGYTTSGANISTTHSWSTTGAKSFRAFAQDNSGAYSAWSTFNVTVTEATPIVLLTASPSTYVQGGAASTLTWSSSNATSCTGTNFSTGGATSGTNTVSPSATTIYTATCTGAGGSGSDTATVTYQCTPSNQCSGQSVVNSCTGVVVQSCSYQCNLGACVAAPTPGFVSGGSGGDATLTGHLQVRPTLVPRGLTTRVYWNVSNVEACSVSGTNGDSWSGVSSGAGGKLSGAIFQRTTYTLSCDAYAEQVFAPESATVNIVPVFQEL